MEDAVIAILSSIESSTIIAIVSTVNGSGRLLEFVSAFPAICRAFCLSDLDTPLLERDDEVVVEGGPGTSAVVASNGSLYTNVGVSARIENGRCMLSRFDLET